MTVHAVGRPAETLVRLASLAKLAALLLAALTPAVGGASSNPCIRWMDVAATEAGVPRDLLRAVALVESGRGSGARRAPWPWTVHAAGNGVWFRDRETAAGFVRAQRQVGRSNFDVGCFQLNYHWHGAQFRSAEAMLDPEANARYAARFLARLYRESGSWESAAKAYHSRTPAHAERYWRALSGYLAPGTSTEPAAVVTRSGSVSASHVARVRSPGSALALRAGSATSQGRGSLVPLGAAGGATALLARRADR